MDNAKQVFTEEMQKLTVDGLKNMGDWIQGAKDFAIEQAPLFAQEYVRWYAVDNIRLAIALMATVAIFVWGANKANSTLSRCDWDVEMISFIKFVMSVVCFAVCTILTVCAINSLGSAVKAYVAPRVVIVEGIKDILELNK
jgi:hypothetical protein